MGRRDRPAPPRARLPVERAGDRARGRPAPDRARRRARTCRLDRSVEQRADIVAARARIAVADRQLTDAKLQFAPTIPLVVLAGVAAISATLGTKIPSGFIPDEDQGYGIISVQLPDGASLQRTKAVIDQINQILAKEPGVETYNGVAGFSIFTRTAAPYTRRVLGTAVIAGMAAATLLGIFFIPSLFVFVEKLSRRRPPPPPPPPAQA